MERAGTSDVAVLKRYVEILPKQIIDRFIAPQHDAAIVQGRVPDIDSQPAPAGGQRARPRA